MTLMELELSLEDIESLLYKQEQMEKSKSLKTISPTSQNQTMKKSFKGSLSLKDLEKNDSIQQLYVTESGSLDTSGALDFLFSFNDSQSIKVILFIIKKKEHNEIEI